MKIDRVLTNVTVLIVFGIASVRAGGDAERAEVALQNAIEKRFPTPLESQWITDAEVQELVALSEAEDDESLLYRWENLIHEQQKVIAPVLGTDYKTPPEFAFAALLRAGVHQPKLVDRISRIVVSLNTRATRYDVFFRRPVLFTEAVLRFGPNAVSPDVLQDLSQSLPDAADYVLAFYNAMEEVGTPLDAEEIYRMYQTIDRDNYLELFENSSLFELGLVPELREESFVVRRQYELQDRIQEVLQ